MNQKIEEAIIALIEAGESMTDAAETCGHDDCISGWKVAVKKAKSAFPDYENRKKEIDEKIRQKKAELHEKKEKAFFKKERDEDAKILASFVLGLSADGKVQGL